MTDQSAEKNPTALLADLANSFDHAPWAVTEISGDEHVVRYANAAFCRLIQKDRGEVIGVPFDKLVPSADECLVLLDRVFRTGQAASFTADDQTAPFPLLFSYNLWPVKAEGRTAGVVIQLNETGRLHETRQAISQALLLGALHQDELIEAADAAAAQMHTEINERRRREIDAKLLANEVAHRVKNNLQVIASLISNERKRTPAPWEQGYRAMQDRIIAIARLYDLMSQSSRDRLVDVGAYVKEIAKSLSDSLLGPASQIQILVDADSILIDSERAVPLGLLVNELGTNAVKHAFPSGQGHVTLSIRRTGSDVELGIADDGIGMPAENPANLSGKHGSDYVAIFVRQLQGTLEKTTVPTQGTVFRIRFPLSVPQDQALRTSE